MKMSRSIFIPRDSVNDESVVIVGRPFADGDFVAKGQSIIEYETSKAVISVEAEADVFIAYTCEVGQNVRVGAEVAATFEKWDVEAVAVWRAAARPDLTLSIPSTPGDPDVSPVTQYSDRAEALIAEHKLDKKHFAGMDLVSARDVEQALFKSASRTLAAPKANKSIGKELARGGDRRDRERIVVVCANQIASEVVKDVLAGQDDKIIVGYVVDKVYRDQADLDYLDVDVFEFPEKFDRSLYDGVILAMGGSLRSMRFRKKVFEHYKAYGVPFTNIISNSAVIASHVALGTGNIIEGGTYIGTHASLGDNNFVSYATVIGHHNVIGSHNLFAPGVTMAGLVEVGDDCILPTGVNFMDKVRIGNRVILPLGYNVISDLKDDTIIKMKNPG